METQCPARSGIRPDACEFKEDGVRDKGSSWGVTPPVGSPAWGHSPLHVPVLSPCSLQLVKDCSAPVPQRGGSVLGVTCIDSTTDVSWGIPGCCRT